MLNLYTNTIIYANMLPLILLVLFFILVCYNPVFNKRQSKLFKITTLIAIFMIIDMSLDFYFTLFNTSDAAILRTITTFLNFTISPIVPLLLYKISNPQTPSRWIYSLLIINIILCIISIPTGIIFSVNSVNSYSRGVLFFIPFTITILYMLFLIIHSQHNYLRSQFSERILLFVIIFILAFAMILEIIFGFHFFVWTSTSISLPLYYLLLNINHAILDPLTGAFNRLKYTKDIDEMRSTQNCVAALIDINNFKNVNDQYGHEVGDQFLIQLVKIVNSHIASNGSIYRIGGDEFVVIAKKQNYIDKLNQCLIAAKEDALNNKIDFSYGIDAYHPQMDMDTFLANIDQLMYENKRKDKTKKGMQ